MRLLLACGAFLCQAYASDTIEAFGRTWKAPIAADWKLETMGDTPVLQMLTARPSEKPRRPTQFVLTDTSGYQRVTLDLEVKRQPVESDKEAKALILVYAYRDADHFNYVHLSSDKAVDAPYHNGVFHVYGGDRVRISPEQGPAALPTSEWSKVRMVYDANSGIVSVTVDGKSSPSLEAVDLSLSKGMFGFGSFFNKAEFRKVKVTGVGAE